MVPKKGPHSGPKTKPQLCKLYLRICQRRLPKQALAVWSELLPPRAYARRGGEAARAHPALSDVDIRMPKIADSNPKRPTPARENSTFFRTVLRDADRCRNRCKRTLPTREPQPIWHPTKSRTVSPGTASGSGRDLPKHISKKRKNVPESAPVMDP